MPSHLPAIDTAVADPAAVLDRYRAVRAFTEALAAPLCAEDQVVQSMPDVSPTKWHRAHVTWFFETFVLEPHLSGYEPANPAYRTLFNSYYEQVGEQYPRARRGLVSRPGVAEVGRYRQRVDDAMARLLERAGGADLTRILELVRLGLQHEQQHQELLLMDLKHVFSCSPLDPSYVDERAGARAQGRRADAGAQQWLAFDGGLVEIGHEGDGAFAFDNEGPRHAVYLEPFRLADRLVTCGEWLEFIADDGYGTPQLWLSDGWAMRNEQEIDAPLYWRRESDGSWTQLTLTGRRPVERSEPVVHVSHFEADAFARWAGRRLPTETEWEHAAAAAPVEGNLLPWDHPTSAALHPVPAAAGSGLRQLFGDVWEWTASAYLPYPGFHPPEGAIGEYNGKFMSGQMVLRGGACISPPDHVRATYRNFFPPGCRWMFAGVRLATDA